MFGSFSAHRGVVCLSVLLLVGVLTTGANATTFYELSWVGSGGYTMQARFSYDETTAPTVISASGPGPTTGLDSLEITFRYPDGSFMRAYDNVVGGVSSYSFLDFQFDTSTGGLIGSFDVGEDDGQPGDTFLAGNPNSTALTLFKVGTGTLDTGGPVVARQLVDDEVVYKMLWTSDNFFSMVARFAFDPRTAPPVIIGFGTGPTIGLDYLEVTFFDPAGVPLQTIVNVDNGVSSFDQLVFYFDTFTGEFVWGPDQYIFIGDYGPGRLSFQDGGGSPRLSSWGTTLATGGQLTTTLVTDPLELNDTLATATPIGCDQFFFNQANIDPLGDVDVYEVTAPPGFKVRVNLDADIFGSPLDTVLGAFDSAGVELAVSDDDPAPGEPFTFDSYLDVAVPADGILRIAVASYADFDFDGFAGTGSLPQSTGNYVISVNCAFVPGRLYASTGQSDALIEIDPATGAGTFLAPLGAFGSVTDLAFAPGGTLIGATGGGTSNLISIDAATLTETLLCPHSPPGALNGLEFINGVLYGTFIPFVNMPSELVTVLPPGSPGGACTINTIGPTGYGGIAGIAYDVTTDRLYGCTAGGLGTSGPPGQLVLIDRMSGNATPVGAPDIGALACGALEFSSPAFGTEGLEQLYAGIGQADPVFPGFLFRVNRSDGTGVPIGPTGFGGVSGIVFAPGPTGDVDNDGMPDFVDNCTYVPNPDQRDTNADGFGNACDADLNNDCIVNAIDLGLLKASFFVPGDIDSDFNGDGNTNAIDLGILKAFFFQDVGPSPNPCGIENPGFESGDFSGWFVSDHPNPFYPLQVGGTGLSPPGFGFFTSAPTEGGFAALHGFDGGAGSPATISIGQDVFVVPATPHLRADYRVAWNLTDFCSGCADRVFRLGIYTRDGGTLLDSRVVEVLPGGTTVLDSGVLGLDEDLSAFGGQAVFIRFEFEVPEFSTGPAFLQLDNVRFEGP